MTQQQTSNRAVLVVIVLASFLPSFVGSSLSISAPAIGMEFHAPAVSLGWLIAAFILCSVVFVLPFGRLGDLTSRRTLLVIGFLILTVTSLIIVVFVSSFEWLIFLRVVQGIGGACIFATNQAILSDAYPPNMRGRVLGISISAVYIGLACGPVLGGLLTHNFGWRSLFVFIALWALVTLVAACIKLPPNSQVRAPGKLAEQLDLPGCFLYLLATFCLAYGLNEVPRLYSWPLIAASVIFIIAFIAYENRALQPLLAPRVFKAGPNFLLSSFSALLNYGATFAVTYLLSLYLQQAQALSADVAGLVLVTAPLIQAIVSPIAGRLSDRYSPFRLASLGMALCGIALVSLVFINEHSSLLHIFISLAVVGSGFALFSSPNTNAVMSEVPRADYGIGVSFLTTMRNLGQLSSMAVITIVMSLIIGTTPMDMTTPEQIVSITRTCFIVCIAFSVVGIFTSLNRRSRKSQGSNR
ncbi:MAG: MFS transporter [Coriobacteriales bacterium]|jgi:MFS family permease|nr:MFS transporter [Coriobacteriales bacterium]